MSQQTTEAMVMVANIKPLLAGHDPSVQSMVLADLLATWVAGHHPQLRETVLATHDELVRELITHNEKEIFGDAGHPGWADVEAEAALRSEFDGETGGS